MPKAYSADLRERVLLAGEAGLSPAVIAKRFGVGLSTVYLWRQQARAEGRRCAKPHGGGRARGIDTAGELILRALIAERNDLTLDEYREQLTARSGGPRVSRPALCRVLRRLGLRRKKRRCVPASKACPGAGRGLRRHPSGAGRLLRASPAARPQRTGLYRRDRHHHGDDPSLRPCSARRAGTRFGPGRLAAAERPGGALGRGDDCRYESIPAATPTRVFVAFLQQVLILGLRRRHPKAIVLMDNLSAHKPREVEATLTKAGFGLLCLPRHSPDLSPTEPSWSKLKNALRTAQARTRDTRETALLPALDSITPADARGWFNHCGYPFPD